MNPTKIRWPYTADGFTTAVYDFGNGYGALHVEGSLLSPQTGADGQIEMVTVVKNELHPLEFPRFRPPMLNYEISPEIRVTAKTLQGELAKLKEHTNV